MSEKIFILCQDDLGNYEIRYDDKVFHFLWEVAPILNEQQATINILLEELVNAQQQGYVIGFLHKNEPCSLIPKELEDE